MFVSRNGIDDLHNNLYWNLVCHFPSYRSSLSHIFFTTGVLKNFANFSLNASKFVIRDFNTGDFLWNLEKLLKTLFFYRTPTVAASVLTFMPNRVSSVSSSRIAKM